MQEYSVKHLISSLPHHSTFVGVDSDGCIFDTMEVKQKDFFHPAIVQQWNLQPIEKQLCAAAEFIYLYSQSRGLNRFIGLCKTFELLQQWDEANHFEHLPDPHDLRLFCDSGLPLNNSTLQAEAARTGSALLTDALHWSEHLNVDIDRHMPPPPTFEGAEAALQLIQKNSDAIVISQTQARALLKDWHREKLYRYVSAIVGPELGSKIDHLSMLAVGRYPPEAILVVGDAPGDQAAAEGIGSCFYPIVPGEEVQSWQRFLDEAYARFLGDGFPVEYQQSLISHFNARLPESPPWM